MEKPNYGRLEMEIIYLDPNDIITTSVEPTGVQDSEELPYATIGGN